jgi:hypothetical protein
MHSLMKLRKRVFDWTTRSIFDTPPVVCDPGSPVVVLSMAYHADLTMYLIAAKSFARHLRPRRFVVVDDGLTAQDRQLLRHHLGQVEFLPTREVDVGRCPRRGCWERLISIARLCGQHYVIQLDADTVTRARPQEVLDCVAGNRSFTMGTQDGQQVVSALEAARFVEHVEDTHVQILAERALATLPDVERRRYVRGCAGFAGFARGAFDFEQLEAFSLYMQSAIDADNWSRWGSEQVASNYIIANAPDPHVLSVAHYMNWVPPLNIEQAQFLHFIGVHRFEGKQYIRQSRRAIAQCAA